MQGRIGKQTLGTRDEQHQGQQMSEHQWLLSLGGCDGKESWGKKEAGGGNGARVGECIAPGVSTAKGSALQMATTLAMCGSTRKTQVGSDWLYN